MDVNPLERYFTAEFCAHIATSSSPSSTPSPSHSHGDGETWTPSQQYYSNVIAKLVKGKSIQLQHWSFKISFEIDCRYKIVCMRSMIKAT